MLATQASFQEFESLNMTSFNKDAEDALEYPGVSDFPEGFIREKAKSAFDEACSNIESATLSHLCNVMIANRCNKPVAHNYTQLYHLFLKDMIDANMNFVEVGIGSPNQDVPSAMGVGYSFGASLRGWRSYFQNEEMHIFGADVDPRVLFQEERIKTGYINQLSPSAIHQFFASTGLTERGIDFILDDGLHQHRSNLTLLLCAWPYLKKNGLYVIEDMSQPVYENNIAFIKSLALNADVCGFALPSKIKSDNRVLALQKR